MISTFSSRPLAALFAALAATTPAMAQTPEAPPSTITSTIQFIEDRASVPYTLDNGLLFFDALIGDTPVHIMLDNGADLSVIDETLARRLGFRTIPLNQSLQAADGQERPQILAQDVPLRIPGQFEGTTGMLLIDLKPVSASFSRPVDMVLGSEFFALAIAVNRSTGMIDFAPSGVISFNNATTVPLSADDIVEAEIAGQPVRLELDLGDNGGASLYPEAFDRILPGAETTEGRAMGAFGGWHTVRQAANVDTTLGGLTLTGDVSQTVPLADKVETDGRLGSAMFQFFSVIFDRSAGKIMLYTPVNAAASAGPVDPISAAELRRRWIQLMARPSVEVMSSPETSNLVAIFQQSAAAYRAQVREAAAAGAPRACPPEQAELSPDEIVARISEMPEAEQAEDFGVVLGRIFDARYPCRAAS